MSRETIEWLNINTLIGNTDQRGNAWHYKADVQGDEPNHYPGFIPVPHVRRRMFGWVGESRRVAIEVPATIEDMTHMNEGQPMKWEVQEDRQAITRSDTHARLGIFAPGYQMHQYDEWLLNNVATILGDSLGVSSAGLLRGGAVAWVEVSVPDSIKTPEGVTFRPNLLATTSFDGSIATTYKRTITDTVCDNTRDAALAEDGQAYKRKHTRYSTGMMNVADAHTALAMIHDDGDKFAAEIARLCATPVTGKQLEAFLDLTVTVDAEAGKRSKSLAENKRETLKRMWLHDNRVAPWANTAHGVVQMVNTYEHHEGIVRSAGGRQERNMLRTINGDFGAIDRATMATLNQVLATV